MTQAAEIAAPLVYTREDVEAYLRAVAAKRVELELAIAQAKARANEAIPIEDRLAALERRVAQIVAERAQAGRLNASQVRRG